MTVSELSRVMGENHEILVRLAAYLNEMPRAIDQKMVREVAHDANVTEDEAFFALFSAALGLDAEENPAHRRLERDYLRAGLRRLDPASYENDAYIKAVGFRCGKCGKWRLEEHEFLPYEPFVWNHPKRLPDFREIPQIGYFDRVFRFPAVLEGGVDWMTVTPNEIETMKEPIAHANGDVLTLGLGLGYYAFHASEKPNVTRVTVVERDKSVIALFRELLLPHFPHGEKIEILEGDAIAFAEGGFGARHFDCVFADLWHDQSDGLDLYLKLKAAEKKAPLSRFDYWIEPTLLSTLRNMVWESYRSGSLSVTEEELPGLLSDDALRALAPRLKKATK